MAVAKNELKYSVVYMSCTEEEFFVLVSNIDSGCPEELDSFLRVLVAVVKEGLVRCDRWSQEGDKLDVFPSYHDLESYVQRRLKSGESLHEFPEVCGEYVFATTAKGIRWLEEQHEETKRRAAEIIDALERYKKDNTTYPEELGGLYPRYLARLDGPFEGQGDWTYHTGSDRREYEFGFVSPLDGGAANVYGKETGEWRLILEERTSERVKYRNKKTGEEIGVHETSPTLKGHPHYYPPDRIN